MIIRVAVLAAVILASLVFFLGPSMMSTALWIVGIIIGIPTLILLGWIAIIYLSALANKGWFR
jgi:hypothetical protein